MKIIKRSLKRKINRKCMRRIHFNSFHLNFFALTFYRKCLTCSPFLSFPLTRRGIMFIISRRPRDKSRFGLAFVAVVCTAIGRCALLLERLDGRKQMPVCIVRYSIAPLCDCRVYCTFVSSS